MSSLSFKGRQFQRTIYKREGSKSSQKETKKIKENVQYPNVYIKKQILFVHIMIPLEMFIIEINRKP